MEKNIHFLTIHIIFSIQISDNQVIIIFAVDCRG